MANSKRIIYFDFLNVLACLAVIGMHCNGYAHNFDGSVLWKQSMAIEALAYWAVPVFFMVSGATLVNYRKKYSTKDFFKKRIKKTLIPFIVWTLGMLVYKLITGAIVWQGKKAFVDLFLNCKIEGVYWFFIPLFIIYLCMPVLSKLADDKNLFSYMAILGAVFCVLMPFVSVVFDVSYNTNLYFPLGRGYILYVLVGYLLANTEIKLPLRLVIYIAGVGGILLRYFHTVQQSMVDGSLNQLTWGYNALPCFMAAIAVFVFAKYAVENHVSSESLFAKILSYLSSATFGIYLMHIFVMQQMISIFNIDNRLLWWRLGGPIILFVVCLIGVKLIQKIPVVGKYIIPS